MSKTIEQGRLQQFIPLELLAKQVVEGFITGLHKSPFHGFSVEFAEHRIYNPGESIRFIDWKLFGRTDKLFVKKFEDETNLRCQIIIDNSSSMYFPVVNEPTIDNPNKIIFSIYCSAAIMHMLKSQRDAVGISLFSDDIELHTHSKSSPVHHKYLINELEKLMTPIALTTHKKTFAVEALHNIADNIHKRSLVVIFSDMFDNIGRKEKVFSALQHLRHNKHEVILFHVVDKDKELDFHYDNRPYKFIDMESGEEMKLNPGEIKERYISEVNAYKEELKLKCAQYSIDFIEADIKMGFKEVLLPYLLKRQKMF